MTRIKDFGLSFGFSKIRHVTHQMFHKYLLITNVCISASLALTGDFLQQHYEILRDKDRKFDKSRAWRMTVAGGILGAICHYWYQFLEWRFPGRTFKTVMKKVAFDQMVCSPLHITVFFVTICAMEKVTLEDCKEEMKHKWLRLYLAEWIILPPAQVINFYLLPPKFRVLYESCISFGYGVYTSYVKNELPVEQKKVEDKNKQEDENKNKVR